MNWLVEICGLASWRGAGARSSSRANARTRRTTRGEMLTQEQQAMKVEG